MAARVVRLVDPRERRPEKRHPGARRLGADLDGNPGPEELVGLLSQPA
jgi:hypothetical protein